MARKPAGDSPDSQTANADRDRFVAECMREFAKYYAVRGYEEVPTPEAIALRAQIAARNYDAAVAPFVVAETR